MAANMDQQLRDLARKMQAVQTQVIEVFANGLAAHAEQVAEDAKALAPVRSGELRDSIQVVKTDELHYAVEATAPYAADVELGTRHQAAQPFLFPAAEARRSELVETLRANLKNA